ncbi:MAG: hypothetical protein HXX81_02350 [Campylobacterales bacterium]|nr:hypothetical protein [Campylobacterales bacterium]
MAIRGSSDLDKLAGMILAAFDFNMDHLYEFSDTVENKKQELYRMYFEGEEKYDKNQSYTDNIVVAQIFKPKKKMVFLFDYGDMWFFVLECLEIREPKPTEKRFPYGFNVKGEAPIQYPNWEGEE